MPKPFVAFAGPRPLWERLCPLLAGAGYRPLYFGDGSADVEPPAQSPTLGIVAARAGGSTPCLTPQELRTRAGSEIPILYLPETPCTQDPFALGFDDCTTAGPPGSEIRARLGRLVELDSLRQRVASQGEALERLAAELDDLRRLTATLQGSPAAGAVYDPLTGALDSAAFRSCVQRSLVPGPPGRDTPVHLALVNLDHFKRVNDRHGHTVGDAVLAATAGRLKERLPGGGCLGRVGGDTFGVLLARDRDQAVAIASELHTAVAEPHATADGAPIRVTASIGVAGVPAGEERSAEALYRAADNAVFAAKARGRDRVLHSADLEGRDRWEPDANPELSAFENLAQVMTERVGQALAHRGRRILDRVRQEAEVDALTGLFNRRYLDRRLPLDHADARHSAAPLTVALLDVDHFGAVNKTHGWPTGDRVLREVAQRIRQTVRTSDWVARYGGEEVCIVMPSAPLEEAFRVAERVRAAIASQPFRAVSEQPLSVTASIGLGEAHPDDSLEMVFERASAQLLAAKQGGRNQTRPPPQDLPPS